MRGLELTGLLLEQPGRMKSILALLCWENTGHESAKARGTGRLFRDRRLIGG
jgi:transcriptional accessory protein Tex/SPT6